MRNAFLRFLHWLGDVDCDTKPVVRSIPAPFGKTDEQRACEAFQRGDAEGFAFWMLAAAGFTREAREVAP